MHEDVCWSEGIAPPFLLFVLNGGELLASRSCRFTTRVKAPGSDCICDCVGFRADLDAMEKNFLSLSGLEKPLSSLQLSRFSD
jgi:hypothetical protein